MRCEDYMQAIQDLVDGALGPVRRAELQTHLDACERCRALVVDLQKIRAVAPELQPVAPPDHVWLQIAGRLRQEGRVTEAPRGGGRGFALLAIAATLVLAVGGSLYLLVSSDTVSSRPGTVTAGTNPNLVPAGNAPPADVVQSIADDFAQAEKHYQSAIAKLEEAAKTDNDSIDPQTAAILSKNLQVIDEAITESRAALSNEPQSAPARDALFEALRRKVMLLQDTVALMNEMRKGNSAGAAQIVGDSKS